MGNVEDFSAWIFCATAGVFLYVALVDMMPELNSGHAHPISDAHAHKGASRALEIALQILGMTVGVVIMLVIALFEHDIKDFFSGNSHSH